MGPVPSIRRVSSALLVVFGCLGAILAGMPARGGAAESKDIVQRVQLFNYRNAPALVALLNALKVSNAESIQAVGTNDLIIKGADDERSRLRRVIASMDLPRPGVRMDLWGLQLSSGKPDKMAKVLQASREDVQSARAAVRASYRHLQKSITWIPDADFKVALEKLGYREALNTNRSLSLTDVLLQLAAAPTPDKDLPAYGNELTKALLGDPVTHQLAVDLFVQTKKSGHPSVPFESFLRNRGLKVNEKERERIVKELEARTSQVTELEALMSQIGTINLWKHESADQVALAGRKAVLEFAYYYAQFIRKPGSFKPYYLQHTSSIVDDRVRVAMDALNSDMAALFIEPTLESIRVRVKSFDGVEYAQVGRVRVATISGTPTTISGAAKSQFEEIPPLRLSELLTKAQDLETQIDHFIPKVPVPTPPGGTPLPPTDQIVGAGLPVKSLIALMAAFGEDRSLWQELNTGISLEFTPHVLRNASSAELEVNLTVADPLTGTTQRDPKIRPLSRVTEHKVKTSVDIDSLDLLDISTFSSQATLGGNRGYFPIIGTIWKGIFADIPVLGDLFSWRKGPRTVYHQSIVLANTLVSPTAMGIALLHPTDPPKPDPKAPDYWVTAREAVEKVTDIDPEPD